MITCSRVGPHWVRSSDTWVGSSASWSVITHWPSRLMPSELPAWKTSNGSSCTVGCRRATTNTDRVDSQHGSIFDELVSLDGHRRQDHAARPCHDVCREFVKKTTSDWSVEFALRQPRSLHDANDPAHGECFRLDPMRCVRALETGFLHGSGRSSWNRCAVARPNEWPRPFWRQHTCGK